MRAENLVHGSGGDHRREFAGLSYLEWSRTPVGLRPAQGLGLWSIEGGWYESVGIWALRAGRGAAARTRRHDRNRSCSWGVVPATAGAGSQAQAAVAKVTPIVAGRVHSAAAAPPWWNGNCDVNNHPGSYLLGASSNGVEACGPGPNQGGYNYAVRF